MSHLLQVLFCLIISNTYAKGYDLNRFKTELDQLNRVQKELWNHGVSKKLASQDQNLDVLMEDTISTRNAGVQKESALVNKLPKIESTLDKIRKKKFQYPRLRNRSR